MRLGWLCRIIGHGWWWCYPQATPVWGLRLGYVNATCGRCGHSETIKP